MGRAGGSGCLCNQAMKLPVCQRYPAFLVALCGYDDNCISGLRTWFGCRCLFGAGLRVGHNFQITTTDHDDEVGYGDFVPKSVGGYIIACLVAD